MTYEPRIGDRVRRTCSNGTILEGEIRDFGGSGWYATDGYVTVLWMDSLAEETELLHRPVEFKTAVGTCYRHPSNPARVVVNIDDSDRPWMGTVWKNPNLRWFLDTQVRNLVENEGWIEHDLSGR